MAFDNPTRARLARFVSEARKLLASEFAEKFQRLYGISPSGELAPVESLPDLDDTQRATAQLLRERLAHLIAAHPSARDAAAAAVARLSREQAFTILNRLTAVRMAEKRGLIVESVGRAYESAGFRVYCQVAGSALGDSYHRYRRYLFCLFDELAVDLGVLFDRRSPFGLLFPRESCLLKLLDLLNAPDLDALWAEDETIGWIYQYYNDEAERKKMREESAAPRNSRELAVRNQFFTPRYVVEFLTDNTLGRLWYEMTQGNTRLKDQCRYLVRRPNEIFLKPGANPPPTNSPSAPKDSPSPPSEGAKGQGEVGLALSQEDLLKQPVHIPHRPLKDPRTILMLDPACGSMHFGLYAFDLFEVIYDEAWEMAERLKAEGREPDPAFSSFVIWHSSFRTKEAFLRVVPRLIIEHNIHGIDIDPRAVQIAGLSLWLRAHRAWHQAGVKPADRPRITRSNLVCAEHMPGEKELLREFVEQQFPARERPIFLHLLENIFDEMQLAGEAGSLLKIEEEVKTAVETARDAWLKLQAKPDELFSADELNRISRQPELTGLEQAVSTLTTAHPPLPTDFWQAAEQRIYSALEAYAEQAENGGGFQRRLFADDAAQGFAFIDLCRKRYHVVVMNPPFGEQTEALKAYLAKQYSRTKNNLYCAFVERAYSYCPAGMVGLISARTFVMYRDFEGFREEFLLNSARVEALADLGWEVLDGAQVETAAFVLARRGASNEADPPLIGPFIKLMSVGLDSKGETLRQACSDPSAVKDVFFVRRNQFSALPGSPLAYWASPKLVKLFSESATFEPALAYCGRGAAAHVFFFRLAWEIPADQSTSLRWRRLAHGGEYSPFFRENSVFIYWEDNGREVKEYILKQYPYLNGNFGWAIQDEDKYGRVGLTSGKRNERFNVQLMPAGHIFTNEGQGFIPNRVEDVWFCLGYLNSSLVSYFLALTSGLQKTWVYIRPVPVVSLDSATRQIVETSARESFELKRGWTAGAEETAWFIGPWVMGDIGKETIAKGVTSLLQKHADDSEAINQRRTNLSSAILAALNLDLNDKAEVLNDFQRHPADLAFPPWRDTDDAEIVREFATRITSYLVGAVFGRWDIRYARGERPAPELPDPFAPLPVCPPGMLQGDDGLPMSKAEGSRLKAEGRYPLDVAWDGFLVDDPGHPLDIVQRVQATLTTIWGDRADPLEHEACTLLGVPTLREWFRRPTGFFADHLKRYSKSRRQAPIYWPLSTASGSYTLWVYYHRFTDQTLHQVLADFVDPKIKSVERDIAALRERAGGGGSRVGELQELLDELKDFRAELERAIKLPWKPNLNDGVVITACPLRNLFRLPKWRKDLEACWNELEHGDYDWAHIAYSIWPQRVKEKCRSDRSLAIAHALEALCEAPLAAPKAKRGRKKQIDLEGLAG